LPPKPPSIEPVTTAEPSAGSQPSSVSGWFHFLAPSAADVLFITIVFGLSCGALGRILLRDAGIGWHIRNGQQMLLTHAITRNDPFSATINGGAWYAWEWLYDVLIAVIHQTLGLNGVVFFSAAIIAAAFVLTLNFSVRRSGNLVIVFFLLLLSLGASSIHFLARPHVLSWPFTVIWFELLDSAATEADSRARMNLFGLPVLMALWVNVHGGYVVGFALLVIYLADGAIRLFVEREQREQTATWLKRLGVVTLLSFAASFVNPYGYHLHVHVYRYLSDRFLMDRISEFLSPDFHGAAQQCFALLLLITLVALASGRRKLTPARLMVVLFAAYSGFYATRNLPSSSLLITLIIAPVLSESIADAAEHATVQRWLRGFFSRLHSFGSRMGNLELDFADHFWLVLVFLLGLWACIHGGRIGSAQFINAYFDERRFPVEAAEFISKQDIREPIFSQDYWGGYLIYWLYPQIRVAVDDRHDLYGDEFFKDYMKVVFVQPGWDNVLEREKVRWVLMPPDSTLANMLRLTKTWTVVHEDGTAVLFEKSER
jgi:hypothetical protein